MDAAFERRAPNRHHLRAHERGNERQPRRFVGSRFVRIRRAGGGSRKQFLERRARVRREETDAAGCVRRPRAGFGEGGRRQPRGRAIDPGAPSGSIRVGFESRASRKRRVVEPGVPGVVVQERRRLGGDARARRVRRGELRRARDRRADADTAEVHETRSKQDIKLARLVRRVRRAKQSHGARDVRRGQTGRGAFRARRRGRRRNAENLFGAFRCFPPPRARRA